MKMKPITKTYDLKATLPDENTLCGAASVMGVMDRSWAKDVIFPGAFKKALAGFLQNGFVPVGHDWYGLPVAMPTKAKEEGATLYCEATFHSTESAQEARTVCMERIAAGLSVGLSVGFMPDYGKGVHYFDTGADLLKYAEDNGFDLKLFDEKGIRACKGYCRGITQVSELYEFSIVSVPANPKAVATTVKSEGETAGEVYFHTARDLEAYLREAAGLSRKDACAVALHGFKGLQRDADEGEPRDDILPEVTQSNSAAYQRELDLRAFALTLGVTR